MMYPYTKGEQSDSNSRSCYKLVPENNLSKTPGIPRNKCQKLAGLVYILPGDQKPEKMLPQQG